MSESLSTPPDSSDRAEAPVRLPDRGDAVPEGSRAGSRPVRQLPPPPKAFDRPRIKTDDSPPAGWRRWWGCVGRRVSSGFVVSLLFHLLLLLSLAMLVQASRPGSTFSGLTTYANVPVPLGHADEDRREVLVVKPDDLWGGEPEWQPPHETPGIDLLGDAAADPTDSGRPALGMGPASQTDLLLRTDTSVFGGLDGRKPENRPGLAKQEGATAESELAVERGLRWLVAHQRDDGSWNFDHHKSLCGGQCRNPGTEASTTAATAIVLLPLLGAGYTHAEGEYRDVVKRGLYYLAQRTLVTQNGHDLRDGSMYGQGLSAIALCEAYAMTNDETLRAHAQGAIDFICYAQDAKRGGWRYLPGQPGDTTVTGWQLMGLKSGQMARLRVPSATIYLVRQFLTAVQSDEGAQYGYLDPKPRQTTTAIGLLMRMYTGWRHTHPALYRGVRYLQQWGPSETNIYFNYYATQVMHHWGGIEWELWNPKMRDSLVSTQAKTGHEAGSWYFKDPYGDRGGRLYNTAMAVMTLEVYYRYLPLYRPGAADDEFF